MGIKIFKDDNDILFCPRCKTELEYKNLVSFMFDLYNERPKCKEITGDYMCCECGHEGKISFEIKSYLKLAFENIKLH